MSLSIHPLFVFDGPNKPPFKRNKRTGPNIASIPEFLAKQLLKQFGLTFHIAPGEAEAECALLQREGIVDAVLSEDVDTLMFGSGLTFRNWSPESNKSKIPTHVNVYESEKTKNGPSGLDCEGMILVALMSGGDYIPEGVPGCGPKLACEAARAGFGHEMCKIPRNDKVGLRIWRERLEYELHTNESKFFKRKHSALRIPEDFPNVEVLGYYTTPAISTKAQLNNLRERLKWDQDINFAELRTFTAEAFDWIKLGGAKKFVRNLAPVTLIKNLRLRAQSQEAGPQDPETIQEEESRLVNAIHGKRNHVSTDGMTELRISFRPIDLVPIDLEAEEPDDEAPTDGSDSEEEAALAASLTGNEHTEAPASPAKRRAPSSYDPTQLEKIWIFESIVKVGVPVKVQDWEESFRNSKKYLKAKHASKAAVAKKSPRKKKAPNGGMPNGSLDRFTRITKSRQPSFVSSCKSNLQESSKISYELLSPQTSFRMPQEFSSFTSTVTGDGSEVIELLSSSPPALVRQKTPTADPAPRLILEPLPNTIAKRRRSPLRRAQTDSFVLEAIGSTQRPSTPPFGTTYSVLDSSPHASPSNMWPSKRSKLDAVDLTELSKRTPSKLTPRRSQSLLISSAKQSEITHSFSPSKSRQRIVVEEDVETTVSSKLSGRKLFMKSTNGAADADRRDKEAQETSKRLSRGKLRDQSTNIENDSPSTGFKIPPMAGLIKESRAQDMSNFDKSRGTSTKHSQFIRDSASNVTETSICRSPGKYNALPSRWDVTFDNPLGTRKKEVIRIRGSLEGIFAIEEVDLTTVNNRVPGTRTQAGGVKEAKSCQMSEISIVDLTTP